jgi:hypothetical protein
MSFHQRWYLIEDQFSNVNSPQSLFDCSTAVRNDSNDLLDEGMICGDLGIPNLDKVLHNNRNDRIKL